MNYEKYYDTMAMQCREKQRWRYVLIDQQLYQYSLDGRGIENSTGLVVNNVTTYDKQHLLHFTNSHLNSCTRGRC